MISKRKHQMAENVKVKKEKGGGLKLVEPRVSRTIDEMLLRMQQTGEMQQAQHIKSNNHGAHERAVLLMHNAVEAPAYINDKDKQEILSKMQTIGEIEKKNNEKKAKDKVINDMVEMKINERDKKVELERKRNEPIKVKVNE